MLYRRRCALLASCAPARFFESLLNDPAPLPSPPHHQHTALDHRLSNDRTRYLRHVFPKHSAVADRSSPHQPWSAESLASCAVVAVDIAATAMDDCYSFECTFKEAG